MLLQVTAYPVFGSLSLLLTASETTPTGRSYAHLIQEVLTIPPSLDEGSAWDLAWLMTRELTRACDLRSPSFQGTLPPLHGG